MSTAETTETETMTAKEMLKFAHYTKLGAAIALRYQTGLSPNDATDVIDMVLDCHPFVGEALLNGYLSGSFGGNEKGKFVMIILPEQQCRVVTLGL